VLGTAPALLAVLAHARDPGNAGTVVRAADAAGAGGVLLTGDSVDPYNGKCVRASAGSLFHLPVSVGDRVEDDLPACGSRPAGARRRRPCRPGPGRGRRLRPARRRPRVGLRQRGLGPARRTRALADAVVKVPIHGRAESLNLATAAAVCLYASARAHRTRPTG
jgi:TrmH family RNA methyltransferase